MKNSKQLYAKLENLLITNELLTQAESNIICRRGTRKESYWGRHILDVCEFVLEYREPNNKVKELLERTIEGIKMNV